MKRVHAAWASPETLWTFLTSPDTGVMERRLAASKSAQVIPSSWLPRVIGVRQQLDDERSLHNFGLREDRLSATMGLAGLLKTPRDRIGAQTTRMILGHPFVVPAEWIKYPPGLEDLKRIWPVDVSEAMDTLYWGLIDRGDPAEIDSMALKLPCTNYGTARQIVEITTTVARWKGYASPEVFGTWLNIQRNNVDVNRASIGILGRIDTLVSNKDETWAMAQVLSLEGLKTDDTSISYGVVNSMTQVQPTSYTLALTAARYLVSSKDLAINRANEGDMVLRALGEKPLGAPVTSDEPMAPENERAAQRFAEWLKMNEPRLAAHARAETPLIESARKSMSMATACR